MDSEKNIIGLREYSRFIGCDIVIISRAIKNGSIPAEAVIVNEKNGRPQINKALAEQAWGINYRDTRKKSKKQREVVDSSDILAVRNDANQKQLNFESAGNDDLLMGETDVVSNKTSFKEADRLGKIADTQLRQLKVAEMKGELVRVETIALTFYDFSRTLRNGFQNIPDRIIDQLLVAPSRNDASIILQNEINQVLEGLSKIPEYRQ